MKQPRFVISALIVICAAALFAGCARAGAPVSGQTSTLPLPTGTPHAPASPTIPASSQMPTPTRAPARTATAAATSTPTPEPLTPPDLTHVVVALEDLPSVFVVVEPGEILYAPGETIPVIDQEVARTFTYFHREKGQVLYGALFIVLDEIGRARCDAIMPFAVDSFLAEFGEGKEISTPAGGESGLTLQGLGETAYLKQVMLVETGNVRQAEALMFRRGVIGALMVSLSAETPQAPIEEVAKILSDRIAAIVPHAGWMTQELASPNHAKIVLQAMEATPDSCGYQFGLEGFSAGEVISFRLIRPDGEVYADSRDLDIPIRPDWAISFAPTLLDPFGLWVVEVAGQEHQAAHVFRWDGECTAQDWRE